MKTITFKTLAIAASLLTLQNVSAATGENDKKIRIDQENFNKLAPADQERVLYIVDRLETIAATDRSELTRDERKALRTEVKSLKQEAEAYNRGGTTIYLSTAGIIIIILLLIILL
ncbi:MAG TPA: hypothetical protein VGE21_11295 [Flavobacteriales bacterium]